MALPDLPPVLYLIHGQDGSGRAMGGVEIRATSPQNGPWAATSNTCGDLWPTLGKGQYFITAWQNGVQLKYDGSLEPREWNLAWPPDAPILVGLEPNGSQLGPQIPPVSRAPLPPFHQPVNYPTTLPFHPPTQRDLAFYRGNFCGIRVLGAPAVPGSNGDNPECVMACLLDNYPPEIQHAYLLQYAQDGYTHLQRSLGHALYYGHSLEDYIALSRVAREQYGLFCDHWLMGGGEGADWTFKIPDQTVDYWRPLLAPYIDALVVAGVMDCCCVGWQLDQFNIPGNVLIGIIAWMGQYLPQSVPLYTHWVNEALAWWADKGETWNDAFTGSTFVDNRFTWWWVMQPYLTGGHHQGSNEMALNDPKQYQDRLCDTLDPFGGNTSKGNMGQSWRGGVKPFALTAFEVTAQFQFNGACSEDQGDLAGYVLMCTKSGTGLPIAGYGNGARMPNGKAL